MFLLHMNMYINMFVTKLLSFSKHKYCHFLFLWLVRKQAPQLVDVAGH